MSQPSFLGHLGHFLGLAAAQGGSDWLHKLPLHSSQCCLEGCLVNRIIKLSCHQAMEINEGPLGMNLIPFTAQPSRAVWPGLLKGGRAAPSLVSPTLLGPPGNKEKKDAKLLESVWTKFLLECQELKILASVKMDFCIKFGGFCLNKTKTKLQTSLPITLWIKMQILGVIIAQCCFQQPVIPIPNYYGGCFSWVQREPGEISVEIDICGDIYGDKAFSKENGEGSSGAI